MKRARDEGAIRKEAARQKRPWAAEERRRRDEDAYRAKISTYQQIVEVLEEVITSGKITSEYERKYTEETL